MIGQVLQVFSIGTLSVSLNTLRISLAKYRDGSTRRSSIIAQLFWVEQSGRVRGFVIDRLWWAIQIMKVGSFLVALPFIQVIDTNLLELLESPLKIQDVYSRVFPVNVSEETFKFLNLSFSNSFPDLVKWEMRPMFAFPFAPWMLLKPAAYPSSPASHSNINYVISLSTLTAKKSIYATSFPGNLVQFFTRKEFSTSSDDAQLA